MPKSYEIPYSNYPPGVSDDDSHFGEFEGVPENEAQYQSRQYHKRNDPDHKSACKCGECECPF